MRLVPLVLAAAACAAGPTPAPTPTSTPTAPSTPPAGETQAARYPTASSTPTPTATSTPTSTPTATSTSTPIHASPPKAAPGDLIDVRELVPDLVLDLRYATPESFLKAAVYPADARCLLRRSTAERLRRVADALRAEDGTRLRAFDCYRPLAVQRRMWELFPRKGYVADPKGGSVHNRGAAIDLTLAARDGSALPMPTDFDEFSRRAWHSSDAAGPEQATNRARLRKAMEAEGFGIVRMEWWHYEDPDKGKFPVLDVPFEAVPAPAPAPAPAAR